MLESGGIDQLGGAFYSGPNSVAENIKKSQIINVIKLSLR